MSVEYLTILTVAEVVVDVALALRRQAAGIADNSPCNKDGNDVRIYRGKQLGFCTD